MNKIPITTPNSENPKKIPTANFIDDIEAFLLLYTPTAVMEALQETYNKFKMMEQQIYKQKETMLVKVPEIEKAIEIIEHLKTPKDDDVLVDYMISDTIWAKAKVKKDVNTVNLWLGANTMVEYTLDEAKVLLSKNLVNAKGNLKTYIEDLSFLKDQVTTIEVNIARTYNTNIKLINEGKVKPPVQKQQ